MKTYRKPKSHRVLVQKRNLVGIPKDIREKLQITEGDILDLRIEGNKIILEPFKLIPSSQSYFWSDKTQNDMKEAKKDVEDGRVREFKNVKEFVDGLEDD
jgi:AbrB family looped-hinge helix DNA binding protein